ncbi:MAG: response regulator transcription factor [Bacteroidota bacterium]
MDKIRILIADDHPMFRTGLVHVLQNSDVFEVVGEAGDGEKALALLQHCHPQVILMDIHLPVLDGIAASKQISESFPEIKILALSHSSEQHCVLGMVKAGAAGYLLKNETMEELKMAIQTLAKGNSYFSREISSTLFAQFSGKAPNRTKRLEKKITNRELEILRFVAEELSNKEIADKLFISPRTVETHKRNLIQKLKVKNAIGLVKYYLKMVKGKEPIYGNPV